MREVLVVVDMQEDFVRGIFGSKEAVSIISAVKGQIKEAYTKDSEIVFLQDTHGDDYMETVEGAHLPVTHCVRDSGGWKIIPELTEGDLMFVKHKTVLKPTFGGRDLISVIERAGIRQEVSSILLVGVCTDICVISNALMLKAFFPDVEISVDASACAGTTPENNIMALRAMGQCHINILNAPEGLV